MLRNPTSSSRPPQDVTETCVVIGYCYSLLCYSSLSFAHPLATILSGLPLSGQFMADIQDRCHSFQRYFWQHTRTPVTWILALPYSEFTSSDPRPNRVAVSLLRAFWQRMALNACSQRCSNCPLGGSSGGERVSSLGVENRSGIVD